jgi:hypothetical protein
MERLVPCYIISSIFTVENYEIILLSRDDFFIFYICSDLVYYLKKVVNDGCDLYQLFYTTALIVIILIIYSISNFQKFTLFKMLRTFGLLLS